MSAVGLNVSAGSVMSASDQHVIRYDDCEHISTRDTADNI